MGRRLLYLFLIFLLFIVLVNCRLDTSETSSLPDKTVSPPEETVVETVAGSIIENIRQELESAGFSESQIDTIESRARANVTAAALDDSTDITLVAPKVLEGALMGVTDIEDHDSKVSAVEILTSCIILSSQSVASESRLENYTAYSVPKPQYSLASFAGLLKTITTIAIQYMDDIGIESESLTSTVTVVIEGITGTLTAAGISTADLPAVVQEVTEGAVSALDEAGIPEADIAEAVDAVTSGALNGLQESGVDTATIADLADEVVSGSIAGLEDVDNVADIIETIITSIKSGVNDALSDAGVDADTITAIQDTINDAAEAAHPDNSLKAITDYSFTASLNSALTSDVAGTIDETNKTIGLTVPFATDITALIATYTTTGASVAVGSTDQTSDVTANDFSSTVTYTVTALDETTQDYTVSVSSLLPSLENYIKADNSGAGDEFGISVSLSGDTVAIGAHLEDSDQATITTTGDTGNASSNPGAVYVFTRTGAAWSMEKYIKADYNDVDDNFGQNVSLDGDTLAVGSIGEDSSATGVDTAGSTNNGSPGSGAVYVYTRSGTAWSMEAYIKADNNGGSDQFGRSVSVSGDTLAVGANQESSNQITITPTGSGDNTNTNSGAVYVFTRSGTTWTQQAYIKADNNDADDNFGYAVSLSGDTLAVGAYEEDSSQNSISTTGSADDTSNASGAVYIFTRSGTTWTQQAYIKADNSDANDYFGRSLSLSGDTLAVGAYGEASNQSTCSTSGSDDDSVAGSGAVYIFTRSGTDWSQEAYIKADNVGTNDGFGWSVSLDGDWLAVGANAEDSDQTTVTESGLSDNSNDASGAVYIFTRNGTTWSQKAYIKADNNDADDQLGVAVSLDDETLAVGANQEDSDEGTIATTGSSSNASADSGAAYIFK